MASNGRMVREIRVLWRVFSVNVTLHVCCFLVVVCGWAEMTTIKKEDVDLSEIVGDKIGTRIVWSVVEWIVDCHRTRLNSRIVQVVARLYLPARPIPLTFTQRTSGYHRLIYGFGETLVRKKAPGDKVNKVNASVCLRSLNYCYFSNTGFVLIVHFLSTI